MRRWLWFFLGIFLCVWKVETINKEINLKDVRSNTREILRSFGKLLFQLARNVASEGNVSLSCQLSLLRLIGGVTRADEWAMKMLDASGKPPAGILYVTTAAFGDYDECLDIVVRNARQKSLFEGKYCMVKMDFTDSIIHQLRNATNLKILLLEVLVASREISSVDGFHLGVCVPSNCDAKDVNEVVHLGTRDFGLESSVACETKHVKEPNTEQLVFLCIFAMLATVVFVGTALDAIHQYRATKVKSGELKKFLIAFSLYSNTNRLFCTIQRDSSLAAVRGCRVLTAFWIILEHIYFYPTAYHFLKYRRLANYDEFTGELLFRPIQNGTVSIDTFFMISGMLFVCTGWRTLEKNKGWINPLTYITQRMARILLVEAFVIALFMVLPLFGNGPIWNDTFKGTYAACRDNWWTNLLFIQNFCFYERTCLQHTWFLGAWLQVLCLTFGVILILYRSQSLGICINILLIVVSCCVTGFLTSWYNLPSHFSGIEEFHMFAKFLSIIHTRPYTYLSSYCVGMILGYAIITQRHPKLKHWMQFTGWLLSASGAVCAVYGPHFFNTITNKTVNVLYAALHRTIWSSAVAWMLFACITGYGGVIGRLLSWKGMIVLDRMSLSVYLLHPLPIYYYAARSRALIYLSHVEQVHLYLATIVIALLLSCGLNVMYEQPMMYIEKFIVRMFSKNSPPDVVRVIDKLSPTYEQESVPETSITLKEPKPDEHTSSKL